MSTSSTARQPILTIRPGATSLRRYLSDLVQHRDLVQVLGLRDLKL